MSETGRYSSEIGPDSSDHTRLATRRRRLLDHLSREHVLGHRLLRRRGRLVAHLLLGLRLGLRSLLGLLGELGGVLL